MEINNDVRLNTEYPRIKELRNRRRNILVDSCGARCIICGYDKTKTAFVFHHIDATKKEFTLSSDFLIKWEKIVIEAKKCILICRNCHAEVHDGFFNKKQMNDFYKKMKWDEQLLNQGDKNNEIRKKVTANCKVCEKSFIKVRRNQKYCSNKCSKYSQRKVKRRPSKEKLLKSLEISNYTQVAKKYGVSDSCIRKWIGIKNNSS